jgi:hypothetical protein
LQRYWRASARARRDPQELARRDPPPRSSRD